MKRSDDRPSTKDQLKSAAHRLGFQLFGVCPAVTPTGIHRFKRWLEAGYGGKMEYLISRRDAYQHPRSVLESARSIVMLGMQYSSRPANAARPGQGRAARYAWGEVDYHDVIHQRLKRLAGVLQEFQPDCTVRGVVDTAPILEREFAQLAGLGWAGKNTLLINRSIGSWFFLAALLTDVQLDYDEPHHADHCGTCRACLDACPTDAFPQPYVLDATRCISYLTIELRDAIPDDLRSGLGNWLFGCDICQEVCPWNRNAPDTEEPAFEPQAEFDPVDLAELFHLADDDFRRRFRRTPMWRAKRRGLLRNAAIVLGNQPATDSIPALTTGLNDVEPLVRGASAWALGQIGGTIAIARLGARRANETDADVLREIEAALGQRR